MYGRVERGQNSLHRPHDGGLPEQRSSAAPPSPNGCEWPGRSSDAPAFWGMPLLRKLTHVRWLDAEKPQVTEVSAQERVRARRQYFVRTVAHSYLAASVRPSRRPVGRSLRRKARLVANRDPLRLLREAWHTSRHLQRNRLQMVKFGAGIVVANGDLRAAARARVVV